MKRKGVVLLIILVLLVGAVLFSFSSDFVPFIARKTLEYKYSNLITTCKIISSNELQFDKIRKHKGIYQIVYEIAPETSCSEIENVLNLTRQAWSDYSSDEDVWQIIICLNHSEAFEIGDPVVILTNQSSITGTIHRDMDCLNLCRLEMNSDLEYEKIGEYDFDYIRELTLYGTLDSFNQLKEWKNLEQYAYSCKHIFGVKCYSLNSLNKDNLEQLLEESNLSIPLFSDLLGEQLYLPIVEDENLIF